MNMPIRQNNKEDRLKMTYHEIRNRNRDEPSVSKDKLRLRRQL